MLALAGSAAGAQVLDVQLAGIEGRLWENAWAFLAIADEHGEEVTEGRARYLHARAPEQIEGALRPFGFYEPRIEASLELVDGVWAARYHVEAGLPVIIDEVEITIIGEGLDAPVVREVLDVIPLRPGTVLNHARYEEAKRRLFEAAYDDGYIDADYRVAEMRVRRADRQAEIRMVLDTGPRYFFGDIIVDQDILSERFMQRFVPINPGDPFDRDRLADLQISLTDSGYFAAAGIEIRREDTVNQRVPVTVRTTPATPQEYVLGLGYASDIGPRGSLGMQLRRINRHGHRFRADLHASGIRTTAAVDYQIPVRAVATDFLSNVLFLGTREIGDIDTEALSVGARWNDIWRNLQRRMYLEARRERYTIQGTDDSRLETVLFTGFRLSSTRAEDPLFTRHGHSWSADLRGGADAVWASTDFGRILLTASLVRPLGERGRFLWRGEYGAITVGDLDALPPSQRFFAGGERSVRGYRFEQLSPRTPEGMAVGGRYLLTTSIEFDYLLLGNYGLAVFYDAGNAANDRLPSLQRAAGIGLRWRSPVGMLSIDIAHPFDDPDTPFRLHLSIGSGL
jgi:translocation and assembly module TamA